MLVDFCTSQGHDRSKLLDAAGLDLREWQLGYDLSPTQFGRIYQRALWLMGDESLGMVGGHAVPNGSFRMLCLCVVQCHSLSAAIARTADYCEIAIGYGIKPVVQRSAGNARLVLEPTRHATKAINQDTSPNQWPLMLLIWVNFLSWLVAQPLPVAAVTVKSKPGRAASHHVFFDCDVQYGATQNAVIFPASALDWAINRDDSDVALFLEDALPTLISPRRTMSSWTKRVLTVLSDAGHGKPPGGASIAKLLNVSQATLRRRLASETTSVQQLKDQHRCSVAMRYLASSSLTLKAIGLRCGFDNPGDFNRAFRRWSGQTPGQYRSALREP